MEETNSYVEKFPEFIEAIKFQKEDLFWTHEEIKVEKDEADLKVNIPVAGRHGLMFNQRLFTKYEDVIGNDYWIGVVHKRYKNSEIRRLAICFADIENNIHFPFYRKVNEVMGTHTDEFYEAFETDPVLIERVKFMQQLVGSKDTLASMGGFAFMEGAVLFTAFAFIKSFGVNGQTFIPNLIAGINMSILDENFHMQTACEIFKKQLELEGKNGALTDEQASLLEAIYAQKEVYEGNKKGLESTLASVTADMDQGNIEALRRKADTAASSAFEEADMVRTAEVLSHRDEEHTIKEDPYKMAAYNHSLAKDLEAFKDVIGRKRDVWKHELDTKLELFKGQVAAGKVPGVTPDAVVNLMEAVPGGTNSLDAYGNPDVVYMKKADEAIAASTASHSDSNRVLWNAFTAAKGAGGIGATNYLNTLYGKGKWENIESPEQLAALTKGNPYVYMKRAVDYLKEPKNPTGDWGKEVLNSNSEFISKADEKSQSFNATITGFKAGVKKVTDKLAYNPDFRYANKMLNEYGMISRDEKPTQAFIKAYQKDHPDADFDDIEDSYHAHVSEFFEQYNKTNGGGITSSTGLSYTGVDSGDRSNKNNKQINSEILNVLNQAYAKPGSFKALIGNASATNFASAKESDPGVAAFFNQFRMDMAKATLKDAKRPIYNVIANSISADSTDQSSFTIVPSKEYVEQYMAQNKDKPGLVPESIISEGATFFFNNKLVDSQFNSAGKTSNYENILTNLGSTQVTTYADDGGILDIKYDKFSGKTTIYPTLKRNSIDRPMYDLKISPIVVDDIRDVQSKIDELNLNLQTLSMTNQQIDQQKALLNQQKSQ